MPPLWMIVAVGGSCLVTAVLFLREMNREPGKMRIRLTALHGLVVVWFAGVLVLPLFGLSWRRWVSTVFFLSSAVLLMSCLAGLLRGLLDGPNGKKWFGLAGVLSAGTLSILVVSAWFVSVLVFGGWADRTMDWEGQRVVVESVGIFHEIGYRYAGPFVHGEQVFEWQD